MLRNKNQNITLHKLVGDLKIDTEMKSDLVRQYTNGRETSSAKMLVNECQALINHLIVVKNGSGSAPGTKIKAYEKTPENVMRRKILSICHEMNWKIGQQLDWSRINFWLDKYGYLHKDLNDYTLAQLPKLVTQFENLLKSHYATR